MFNCVAVKKWKQLVAWFPSHGVNCTVDMECNFSRKRDVFMLLRILNLNVSVYYIVFRKIDVFLKKKQLEIQQRQFGKMVIVKAGAYIVSVRGEKGEPKHALRNCTPLAQGTIESSVNNGFST